MVLLKETDAAWQSLGKDENDELTPDQRASLRRLLQTELLLGATV